MIVVLGTFNSLDSSALFFTDSDRATMAVFMLETLKLSKMLKASRDDFNV